MSGTAASTYRAEITALQNYQKEILNTLDAMVIGNAALTAAGAVTSSGQYNGLGTFPEAVSLSNTYDSVMQSMINNFNEISALVTAMANVLGKSAQSYQDTEQQLTDKFNQIVSQYESQSGGFSTPGSSTPTSGTATTPQGGTSGAYNSASTANPGPQGGSGSGSGSGSGGSSAGSPGSISQGNNANASNNTDSEM